MHFVFLYFTTFTHTSATILILYLHHNTQLMEHPDHINQLGQISCKMKEGIQLETRMVTPDGLPCSYEYSLSYDIQLHIGIVTPDGQLCSDLLNPP